MINVELFEGRNGTQAKVFAETTNYIYLFPKKETETIEEYSLRVQNEFNAAYPDVDVDGDEEFVSRFEPEEHNGLGLFEDEN